jgi:phosphatidylserine/phosphatidylglycerophosphate/cardiolipin synthase-like enzyme
VKIDDALAGVVDHLSDGQLHALAAGCEGVERGSAAAGLAPAGASPAALDAVERLSVAWRATPGLTGTGLALALRVALTARRDADARRARPVWTGPGASGSQRLTAGVLHELLTVARERILLVSYAAYTLPEVAAELRAAVERGCQVDVVFETTEDSAGAYHGPQSHAFAEISGITRWHWPADQRTGGAVLHAKLLVVDGRRAFVGSANLTARALTHNLEVGVLLSDADTSARLEDHVHSLMASQALVRA